MNIRDYLGKMFDDMGIELEEATQDQLKAIRENYMNLSLYHLEYGENEEFRVLVMSYDSYRSLSYYAGFEYIPDEDIYAFIKFDDDVIIIYEINDRVERLFEILEDNEEED